MNCDTRTSVNFENKSIALATTTAATTASRGRRRARRDADKQTRKIGANARRGYSHFNDASQRVVEHTFEMPEVAGLERPPSPTSKDKGWGEFV